MLIAPAQRYDTLSRSLHWLMAAIIAASWALIRIKGWFAKGSAERASVSSLHKQLGIALLLLLPCACRGAGAIP
jgi:cytochrome b561